MDHNPKITVEEEIAFTTEKIRNNFSNYSSWHLRSKLLPRLTPTILEAELDLIQNAAFTDPNDQSVWFYHKWLVNTNLQNGKLLDRNFRVRSKLTKNIFRWFMLE